MFPLYAYSLRSGLFQEAIGAREFQVDILRDDRCGFEEVDRYDFDNGGGTILGWRA
jgi:hypothetical protein